MTRGRQCKVWNYQDSAMQSVPPPRLLPCMSPPSLISMSHPPVCMINSKLLGNLGFRTEQWAIEEFFKSVGTVKEVRIAIGEDERPRGFAHVEFATNAEA